MQDQLTEAAAAALVPDSPDPAPVPPLPPWEHLQPDRRELCIWQTNRPSITIRWQGPIDPDRPARSQAVIDHFIDATVRPMVEGMPQVAALADLRRQVADAERQQHEALATWTAAKADEKHLLAAEPTEDSPARLAKLTYAMQRADVVRNSAKDNAAKLRREIGRKHASAFAGAMSVGLEMMRQRTIALENQVGKLIVATPAAWQEAVCAYLSAVSALRGRGESMIRQLVLSVIGAGPPEPTPAELENERNARESEVHMEEAVRSLSGAEKANIAAAEAARDAEAVEAANVREHTNPEWIEESRTFNLPGRVVHSRRIVPANDPVAAEKIWAEAVKSF